MNLDNFTTEIDPIIVKRGFDYYKDGHVESLKEIKQNLWQASVSGSWGYSVEVKINNAKIEYSSCDCPYDFGPYCKHEVAVFYNLQDMLDGKEVVISTKGKQEQKEPTEDEKLLNTLAKHSREKLQNILIDLAMGDKDIYTQLMTLYNDEEDKIPDKKAYKKMIRQFLNSAKDRHGFIDYRHAQHSVEGAITLLEHAEKSIQQNKYKTAAAMGQSIIETIVPALQFTDDSDGTHSWLIDAAFGVLDACAELKIDDNYRKEFLDYALKEAVKKKYSEWDDFELKFYYLAYVLSTGNKDYQKVLKSIEKNMSACAVDKYLYEQYALLKYKLLVALDDLSGAEKFFSSNLVYPGFRRIAIEQAMTGKNYEQAEKLTLDGENVNAEYPGTITEWKEKRFEIYELAGSLNKMRGLAREFIFEGDFEYYKKLKKIYKPKEWQPLLTEIIDKIKRKNKKYNDFQLLNNIYIEENMFKELLEEVKIYPDTIRYYYKYLLEDFSEGVYLLYREYILEEAKHITDRKKYRALCKIIKELVKINGKDEARSIIEYLSKEYVKRPAFLDELGKVKVK